jgi:folate-binding protein YgfZ
MITQNRQLDRALYMATTLTDLNNFDLLAVSGDEAAKFLQGQLTCDINKVSPAQSVRGAYCDINGRVIANMRVLASGSSYLLLTSRGMGYALKKTLEKYIVFSKAKITLETSSWERFGMYGPGATQSMQSIFGVAPENADGVAVLENCLLIRLPDAQARYEILLGADSHELRDQLEDEGITDDLEEWELADIRQGTVNITADTQDTYTPQLLNYDITGVIDFKKGCFPGQEIVARMHYRAPAKKRLYRATVKGVRAGNDSMIMAGNESVGEIISVAMTESGQYELLVILPCELVEQKTHLELRNHQDDNGDARAAKASLQILDLPLIAN